jgi:hypothetical protein
MSTLAYLFTLPARSDAMDWLALWMPPGPGDPGRYTMTVDGMRETFVLDTALFEVGVNRAQKLPAP